MQMKIQGMPPTRDSDKWRKQSGILDSCMVVQTSSHLFPQTFASDSMDGLTQHLQPLTPHPLMGMLDIKLMLIIYCFLTSTTRKLPLEEPISSPLHDKLRGQVGGMLRSNDQL